MRNGARHVDIAVVIGEAQLGRTQILVLALCALAAILDGFDLQAIAFTGPVIAREWGIEATALGAVFSAALVGMTFGALLFGMLGDRFGRRAAVGLSVATFGLFTLAIAGVNSYTELLVYRFLAGLGIGGTIPSVTTLMAEYAPNRLRTMMIALMSIGIPIGGVLGGLLAAQIIPTWGWKSVFFVGGVFPLLLLPLIVLLLPESLHFLVAKGGAASYTTIASILNRINPSGLYQDSDTFVVPDERLQGSPVKHLFGSSLVRSTLLLWLAFFINLLAMYFLMTWLPSILVDSGFQISRAINVSVLFSLGGAMGGLILARLMTRYGSRQMLTIFFLLDAFVCTFVIRLAGYAPSLLFLVIFLSGFITIGAQIGLNALAASIYQTDIRSTGVGWALGIARFGAIAGPVLGGVLAASGWDIQDYFLIFGLVLMIAAIAVAFIQFNDRPGTMGV